MTSVSEADKSKLANPCVCNCCLDYDDICLGCGRSLSEILDWHCATAAQKRDILERSESRKRAHKEKWHKPARL